MLKRLTLDNFTVFEHVEFEFGMLNVIHGENGTGKTHVLKTLYLLQDCARTARQFWLPPKTEEELKDGTALLESWSIRVINSMQGLFAQTTTNEFVRWGVDKAEVTASVGPESTVGFGLVRPKGLAIWHGQDTNCPTSVEWDRPAVYLPASDVLARDPSWADLADKYLLREESKFYDLQKIVRGPKIREQNPKFREIVALIQSAIGGRADAASDGRVFIEYEGGHQVWATIAASGHIKLGALAMVLERLDLSKGMVLHWDEPEANLNPALLKVAAKAIVMLAQAGVQVFVATHSLFLTREIDIYMANNPNKLDARFFGLLREGAQVVVHQGPELADAGDLVILDEELKQANEYMQLSWGAK